MKTDVWDGFVVKQDQILMCVCVFMCMWESDDRFIEKNNNNNNKQIRTQTIWFLDNCAMLMVSVIDENEKWNFKQQTKYTHTQTHTNTLILIVPVNSLLAETVVTASL